jgi:hypothetical protein
MFSLILGNSLYHKNDEDCNTINYIINISSNNYFAKIFEITINILQLKNVIFRSFNKKNLIRM